MYVSECADLVEVFFGLYGESEVWKDVVAFTNHGASFQRDGLSILDVIGFHKHVLYPPPVHQYLSPNDNRLHGTAKTAWRAARVDLKDDVKACLLLLNLLDRDIAAHGKEWFDRNMHCLTEQGAKELISGAGRQYSHLSKERLRNYRLFANQDPRGNQQRIPKELRDELDGRFWDTNPE